jgi:serine phosphatase RsbU (regulator of sigma subunit)
VRLDGGEAVIASAGHPAPVLVRDDGRVREIGVAGPILGAWAAGGSRDRAVSIAPDETLILFTDGVLDARGEHERFGLRRLKRVLSDHAGRPPEQLLSELEAELERFQVGPQADDTAALALRPEARDSVVDSGRTHPAGRVRTLPLS